MPDITMCNNDGCPLRKSCYRHSDSGTQPDYRQSFSQWQPHWTGDDDHDGGGWKCEGYWPTRERNSDEQQ